MIFSDNLGALHTYLLFIMRTLTVSSLGQVVESVGGLVQVEPGGLAAEMTHWREASSKVNEVQDPAADFKHRLAQSIGFLSTLTAFATVIVNIQDCMYGIKTWFLFAPRGALYLKSPSDTHPCHPLINYIAKQCYINLKMAFLDAFTFTSISRTYPGSLVALLDFHCVGVSWPLQSVCRPRDVIYFWKLWPAAFRLPFPKCIFPRCTVPSSRIF